MSITQLCSQKSILSSLNQHKEDKTMKTFTALTIALVVLFGSNLTVASESFTPDLTAQILTEIQSDLDTRLANFQ